MEEAYGMPKPQILEHAVPSGDEQITEGLESLGNEALTIYSAIMGALPYPPSQLERWVQDFNNLPASERSKGITNPNLTLEHREPHSRTLSTRHKLEFIVHRAPDGELTLEMV